MNRRLEDELELAAGKAFKDLFQNHDEEFYYCSLISQECAAPYICAWSKEALQRFIRDCDGADEDFIKDIKWSYADSPYCAYGWEYFNQAAELFQKESAAAEHFSLWFDEVLNCMERVMRKLDGEGLFGTGQRRNNMMIAAEVMPPDYGNTLRALRLNDEQNIREWLEEAAETDV